MLDPEHDQVISLSFERRLCGGDCLVLRSHAGRDDERSRRSAVDTEQNARWNPAFEITGAVSTAINTARAAGCSRPRPPASGNAPSDGREAFRGYERKRLAVRMHVMIVTFTVTKAFQRGK